MQTFEQSVQDVYDGLASNTAFATAVRCEAMFGHKKELLMQAAVEKRDGKKPAPAAAPAPLAQVMVTPTTLVAGAVLAASMPAPDTLLDYGNGLLEAAMFHYCGEGMNYGDVAKANGFETRSLALYDDKTGDAPDLAEAYEKGGDAMELAAEWHPAVPKGWTLGAKYDTEEGLFALFVRRVVPVG